MRRSDEVARPERPRNTNYRRELWMFRQTVRARVETTASVAERTSRGLWGFYGQFRSEWAALTASQVSKMGAPCEKRQHGQFSFYTTTQMLLRVRQSWGVVLSSQSACPVDAFTRDLDWNGTRLDTPSKPPLYSYCMIDIRCCCCFCLFV